MSRHQLLRRLIGSGDLPHARIEDARLTADALVDGEQALDDGSAEIIIGKPLLQDVDAELLADGAREERAAFLEQAADHLLQSPAPASGAGEPDTDGGLA